jgi:ankyrin repeat protein
LEATDGYGLTPLHYAARRGDTKIASLLVEAGVDVDAKTLDKETALHYAARRGDTKIASLLVEAGVDVDAKTPDGDTALYLAVRHGATGCVEVLLAAGASLKLREGHGLTPALHYAARRGDTKIASLLVEAGVDVDAKTPDGDTALYLAVRHRATSCVEVLLAAGASPNLREGIRLTPFELALRRYRRMWPLFLRAGAELPAAYPPDLYLGRVVTAGGFKKYAQAHLKRITPTFASMLRLPAQPARRVAEFWLHAGYY